MKDKIGAIDRFTDVQEVREYFETIIGLMPGHVYWKDVNGVLLGCNDIQARDAGLATRQEIVGKTDYDMPWSKQADILRKVDKEIIETGIPKTIEEPSTLADGTEAIFLSRKVPLRFKGKIVGIVGISFDITEQKRTEKELQDTRHKLEGMTLISSSIAHELRTPFATLELTIKKLEDYIPALLDTYHLAEQAKLHVPKIRKKDFQFLNRLLDSMMLETRAIFTFIDILLANVNPAIEQGGDQIFSIATCVETALARYPFQEEQKQIINWNSQNNFMVKGKDLSIMHVIFNLLKNALYYIAKAQKGQIFIWLERGKPYNQLYFKDTGTGISGEILPHIFDMFFTKTYHGAGIGLTFCKMVMESLDGEITCESEERTYAQFVLSFPNFSE